MSRSSPPAIAAIIVLLSLPLGAHPGTVLHTLDAPGRFCTGATFDGRFLWVADYKADRLFKLEPKTGRVVGSVPSPGFWPMGLAWDGTHLYNADRKSKKIFQVDPADGTILHAVNAPSSNPEGLAWDGRSLWVTDYKDRKIMKIDLTDGTAVKTITAPAKSPNGLTFDGAYLWCSDRMTDEIYMIEPDSGRVLIVLDAPASYPRGLAWDGHSLWNLDHQTDRLYALVRRDDEDFRLKNTRRAEVALTHQVKTHGPGNLKSFNAFLAVPEDMPQQKITAVSFSPSNNAIAKDRWQQQIAAFRYENLPSPSTIESVMRVRTEISEIRYFIFPDRCGTFDDIPPDIRDTWTANGAKYLIYDPFIKKLATQLVGDCTNPYYIALNIFDYVREHLEYKLEGGWNAAPVVLKRGTGSCSEYSFCFIALCRAAGVPARYAGAIVVRGDDASMDDVFHRWPEIYLPNYGWIPIDPQGGDKPSPRERALNIGNLSNRFLITTRGGGDSEYLGWYYNCHETYTSDPQVEVNIEAFAEWEPLTDDVKNTQ